MAKNRMLMKRMFDVPIASAIAVLLSPALLTIAMLIVVTSGFPVFFVQKRIGYLGKPFRIIKFRTMTSGSEERTRGQWITANNPNVTCFGRFLRKTSLDELPELFNVLLGDMSLVGPRPTLPEQVAEYDDVQRRRLEVKPGITGWAQVNGRNSLSWAERIKLDVWYVDHWSFSLDLRIMVKTVVEVVRQRNVDTVPPSDA